MAAVQQAHLNFAAPCFVGFWGGELHCSCCSLKTCFDAARAPTGVGRQP